MVDVVLAVVVVPVVMIMVVVRVVTIMVVVPVVTIVRPNSTLGSICPFIVHLSVWPSILLSVYQ